MFSNPYINYALAFGTTIGVGAITHPVLGGAWAVGLLMVWLFKEDTPND